MSPDVRALEDLGAIKIAAVVGRTGANALAAALEPRFRSGPGARLFGQATILALSGREGALGRIAEDILGPRVRPVRAIAFDKRPDANWAVGWHQDRTIAVRERIDAPGFGPWSVKDGVPHVEPPFDVMAQMITMRLHLDETHTDNAPLRVALGSHRFGRVAGGDAAARAAECEELICLAAAGDVWVYRTPVLHASKPAAGGGRRRVVQIDYAAQDLPGDLDWAGAGAR